MPDERDRRFLRSCGARGNTVQFGFRHSESTADMKEQAVLAAHLLHHQALHRRRLGEVLGAFVLTGPTPNARFPSRPDPGGHP